MITYTITKWCAPATKDGHDHPTQSEASSEEIVEFRLLDKESNPFCYGVMNRPSPKPLKELLYIGCVSIEFLTKDTREWKLFMTLGEDTK